MSKSLDKNIPYSNMSFGTEPTKMVKFMRSCFIIQFFNFFALNLKVMKIVVKGHS
jgi:hypothetical protein